MMQFGVVICLVIYFYINEIATLLNAYKDAAGIWHEDRFRPLVDSLVNLFLNIILVKYWGIYGVILSTVIALLFVGMPWLIYNVFSRIFTLKDLKDFLKVLSYYFVVTIVGCIITYFISSKIRCNIVWILCIRILVCLFIPNIVFYFFIDILMNIEKPYFLLIILLRANLKKF